MLAKHPASPLALDLGLVNPHCSVAAGPLAAAAANIERSNAVGGTCTCEGRHGALRGIVRYVRGRG